ncbi:hypothetical protein [Paenibacillus alginolyticus]|uniref:Uncharacterized protein n=1 Tax=Paenibacillus alginolyticus TaxID=59839 RepID=A0ABT4GAP9_9BACL|nr:hypothetical protein [Paenibacillus alginolyticus]MCY9693229.1 hypothetical protein [Paenibacillus alginolyticus]MEC0146002.1 hypothetical protein [Paenibacillus alginolyticus]
MTVQTKVEVDPRLLSRVKRHIGSTIVICVVTLMLFAYFLSIAYPLFWMLMSSLKNTT